MSVSAQITDNALAMYSTSDAAEDAITVLMNRGHAIRKISVLGCLPIQVESDSGYIDLAEKVWAWGSYGAFWHFAWHYLGGSAVTGSGIGVKILSAGYFASLLKVQKAFTDRNVLEQTFRSLHIDDQDISPYIEELSDGHFLVIAHGTDVEAENAATIFERTLAGKIGIYSDPIVRYLKHV